MSAGAGGTRPVQVTAVTVQQWMATAHLILTRSHPCSDSNSTLHTSSRTSWGCCCASDCSSNHNKVQAGSSSDHFACACASRCCRENKQPQNTKQTCRFQRKIHRCMQLARANCHCHLYCEMLTATIAKLPSHMHALPCSLPMQAHGNNNQMHIICWH